MCSPSNGRLLLPPAAVQAFAKNEAELRHIVDTFKLL
jgi:hypothetical protein